MKLHKPVLLLREDAIGTLAIEGNDMPWVYGSFSPLPTFERVAPLFRLLQEALDGNADANGEDADLHLKLMAQVNQLGLVVRHPNGKTESLRDFKIEDDQFEYKTDPDSPQEVAVVIGSAYDVRLLDQLRKFVVEEGGSIREKSYTVAGSQEVVVYAIALPKGAIEAVSETHVGLWLFGPASLVAQAEAALRVA